MAFIRFISLLLLLTACASQQVTPADCRAVGVDVPNGAPMTGRIVEQNIGPLEQVSAACRSPFAARHGCTMAVWPGEYVIWSVDHPRVLAHEQCHALYQAGHK